MEGIDSKDIYTPAWFERHARDSIKPIAPGKWDYSDSLLLYMPGSDESYEALQAEESSYHELITAPERRYLSAIAQDVARGLPDTPFEYIDLGPGTEHKEQFLFDALKAQGKSFIYRPTDISKKFLQLAEEHAARQHIPVQPLYSSFEELSGRLRGGSPRFVSLGLTYSNYKPESILPLLKQIAGDGGLAFINAQLRDRISLPTLVEIYREDAKSMVEAKMHLLGLDPIRDVASQRVTDAVEIWCTVKNVTPILESKGVRSGDEMLIFQSLRPTKESLIKAVSGVFPQYIIFDTGETFVGTLLKV